MTPRERREGIRSGLRLGGQRLARLNLDLAARSGRDGRAREAEAAAEAVGSPFASVREPLGADGVVWLMDGETRIA